MKRTLSHVGLISACAALLLGGSACQQFGPTAAALVSSTQFSQKAYDTDEKLRDETLKLVDRAKGGTSYSKKVTTQIDELLQQVDSAIAAESARHSNEPTVKQWQLIKTKLDEFCELWKTKGKLSPTFLTEAKTEIGGLFATLIKTEEEKPHS